MKKHTIKTAALLLCALLLFSALPLGVFAVREARVEGDYYVLSKADYADKTRAAFLAKLTSFFTDYKFVWNRDGSPRVALPDSWYGVMKGRTTPIIRRSPSCSKTRRPASGNPMWPTPSALTFSICTSCAICTSSTVRSRPR